MKYESDLVREMAFHMDDVMAHIQPDCMAGRETIIGMLRDYANLLDQQANGHVIGYVTKADIDRLIGNGRRIPGERLGVYIARCVDGDHNLPIYTHPAPAQAEQADGVSDAPTKLQLVDVAYHAYLGQKLLKRPWHNELREAMWEVVEAIAPLLGKGVAEGVEAEARKMYVKWVVNQGSPSNRFPPWDELNTIIKKSWIDKAMLAATDSVVKS